MQHVNLEKLIQAQFDTSKFWLMLATICGIGVLVINVFVTVANLYSTMLAVVAALLSVLYVIFLWRSDRLRDNAESTLRKFEMHNSLGWEISNREIANLLALVPNFVKKAARSTEKYDYFASTKNHGAGKLLENLEESAWWTKHQARRMAQYVGIFGVAVFSLAFITLIISLQSALSQTTADNIAKVTIAVIVFMFSGGYIRLAFDYNLLASQADRVEDQSCQLRKDSNILEVEAIKLLHDYQILRANSPLLPSWLWKMMQDELNMLWEKRIASE